MSEHAVLHRDNSVQATEERTWDVTFSFDRRLHGKIVNLDDYRTPPQGSETGVGSGSVRSLPIRPSVSFQSPPDLDLSRAYQIAATAFSPLKMQQLSHMVATFQQALASPLFLDQTGTSMRVIQQAMANMASVTIPDASMLARQTRETVSAFPHLQAAALRDASAMMQRIVPSPTPGISEDTDRPINDAGRRSTDESVSIQVAPVVEPRRKAERLLVELIRRLTDLHDLDANWDSYGALPISLRAEAVTRELLVAFWNAGLIPDDPDFDLMPVPTGGLQLEWTGTNGELEIEVRSDGSLSILRVLPDGDLVHSLSDLEPDLDAIKSLIFEVLG